MRDSWSAPERVAGFASSPPNETLLQYADAVMRAAASPRRAIDLGCGAGRNAVPMADAGWDVFGVDFSHPMLVAAAGRAPGIAGPGRLRLARAAMDAVPARGGLFDLVVAHGIWNLAASASEFRCAVREAARVAAPGAGLFVFTFSRQTLAPDAQPVPGETFVFTQFAGEPQVFLTADQLMSELAAAGFDPDARVPLREHNLPRPGQTSRPGGPVIYETAFRRLE